MQLELEFGFLLAAGNLGLAHGLLGYSCGQDPRQTAVFYKIMDALPIPAHAVEDFAVFAVGTAIGSVFVFKAAQFGHGFDHLRAGYIF